MMTSSTMSSSPCPRESTCSASWIAATLALSWTSPMCSRSMPRLELLSARAKSSSLDRTRCSSTRVSAALDRGASSPQRLAISSLRWARRLRRLRAPNLAVSPFLEGAGCASPTASTSSATATSRAATACPARAPARSCALRASAAAAWTSQTSWETASPPRTSAPSPPRSAASLPPRLRSVVCRPLPLRSSRRGRGRCRGSGPGGRRCSSRACLPGGTRCSIMRYRYEVLDMIL
mmetsp:Transcript_35669/g.69882  ORF Transcript_35669/g.69882 Transcript_35669/m.69882 type:complete len:235 (-) Transcript_35669:205-909(-)